MRDSYLKQGFLKSLTKTFIVLGIAFFAIITILLTSSKAPFGLAFSTAATETRQTVKTKPLAMRSAYTYQREYIGAVEADQRSTVGFERTGLVETLFYNEGDTITSGTVLGRLDTAALDASQQEILARIKQSKAQLALATANYNRIATLDNEAVAEQDKDEARESVQSNQAAVEALEAQLLQVQVDLAKAELKAPYLATILERFVDEGIVVTPGQPVFKLQKHGSYEVRVGLSARAADQFSAGQQVDVLIQDSPFQARVKSILPAKDDSRTVSMLLTLKPPFKGIRPGDTVRLMLSSPIKATGAWVPVSALQEGNRGLWSVYVTVPEKEKLNQGAATGTGVIKRRSVTVVYTNGENAFISGAVRDGEPVVIEGAHKVVPGQAVMILDAARDNA
ncbi:MAG: efflux RND transporter periplasmic adaptor subunit [Cyanobacteria bacterium P01_H01_bin.74]